MDKISEINDSDSLEAWLNTQPCEVAITIANRAALRVLPIWWHWVQNSDLAKNRDLTELPILRCAFISSVAAKMPTDDMKRAATATRAAAATAAAATATAATATRAAATATAATALAATAATAAAATATAATATATATRAATAATAATATQIWQEINADAAALVAGADVWAVPLWPLSENPFQGEWQDIRARLLAPHGAADSGENQAYWVAWYQSVLEGRPMLGNAARTWEMLEKIARIEPEVWERGPEVVNPRINAIWDEYRGAGRVELFKATLYDFDFDSMAHVMRAVPMPSDWETLTDPERLQSFLKDALDLREDMVDLCQAFSAEGMAMQGAGMTSTYMAKVLDELENAETVGALRVGKLVEWGRILEATSLREDTRREFGPMSAPFGMAVDKLKSLIRDHFAHTLARFSQLRDIRMEDDAAPWEVLKELRVIVAAVRDGSGGVLPPLDDADVAILDDILDSIDRMIRELDNTTDEDARSSRKREIDFQMAKVGATAGLYSEKAKKAAGLVGKGGKSADEILKWEKRGKGLWGLLRAIREMLEAAGGPS